MDVDGDGHAEIVVPSNNYAFAGPTGIQVYGDDRRGCPRDASGTSTRTTSRTSTTTRRSPRASRTTGRSYNNYRQNRLRRGMRVLASRISSPRSRARADDGGLIRLTVRIGNGGGSTVAAGVSVAFYDGDPSAGARLLGTALTRGSIAPGAFEDVVLTVPTGTVALPLWVVADEPAAHHGIRRDEQRVQHRHLPDRRAEPGADGRTPVRITRSACRTPRCRSTAARKMTGCRSTS